VTRSEQREQLFEMALAAVTEAVLTVDENQRITYLNTAAEVLTGWRRVESLGKPLSVVLDRRGLTSDIEYEETPMTDPDGRFQGAVLVCRRRRLDVEIALQTSNASLLAHDEALFEEKERAQVTLDSIGDAVVTVNFSGRVTFLNRVAEKLTGWTQSEAKGKTVDEIFSIVECQTGEPITCPTARAIIEDRRVSITSGCLRAGHGGADVAVEVSAAPIHDRIGGVIGAVMVAQDVTAARELSQQLKRLALHDSLTDLPNRTLFSERLRAAITAAQSHGGHTAVLYVDLDRFKCINDSLGHAIGDQLLQAAALRLQGCVRSSDTVCRQGGDEFVVLLAAVAHAADATACAENILGSLQSPYRIGDHELRLTASIGVAVFPDDAAEGEALVRCADVAMYRAKNNGRNNYRAFDKTLSGGASE